MKKDYWFSEENLIRLKGWIRDGLTLKEISSKMGLTAQTLCRWKKMDPSFNRLFLEGKEAIDRKVEEKLLELALKGNVTAIIFWLKNRMPERWRDARKGDESLEKPMPLFYNDIDEE